ncbi:hypothetical protein GVN20_03480 [Runella sp. CRIBMP]|uniref:LamG-like jellyroll fold domain-containing protein n=1 Tax=Runella sp. CRIBMP TaxID=2683261 RepID=UPI001412CA1C|nr:LamG-like jellyroll fold domain-containing protein [Runella sp. CRIBMP]NBB18407.1 hypothetical protein [Runella sp. CRIBMP]
MKKIYPILWLLLSCTSLFAQKQVLKDINAARNIAQPQLVRALNAATTLSALGNQTFTANNTAVQFAANETVLKQLEREKPALVEFSIPISAKNTLVLELIPMAIFGESYKVMDAQNQMVSVDRGIFYKGIIKGDDNSLASLALINGELSGFIANQKGTYVLAKLKNESNYIFYNDNELVEKPIFNCNVKEDVTNLIDQAMVAPSSTNSGCSARPVQIYFEADNSIFTAQGSNMTTATNFVTALFGQVAVMYANENISVQISQLKIWDTTDPYVSANNTQTFLNLFVAQVGTTYTGDLAHLISARDLGGGIADGFESLCQKGAAVSGSITSTVVNVPTYSWNVNVITHEIGHNFGSRHTHSCTWPGGAIDNCSATEGGCPRGPAPVNGGTVMSYCHLTAAGINPANGFGTLPGNLIRNRVNFCIYTNRLDITIGTPTNPSGACNGLEVVVTSTGGTGGKTFSVSPNVGSQAVSGTFTGLTSGTYTFTATDANGCTVSKNLTISTPFAFSTASQITNCPGNIGRIVATPIGNSNTFNYTISPNVGTQSPSGTFNNLPAGTYNFTATPTTNGTCSVTFSATLTAQPPFSIDAPSVSKANSGVSDGQIIVSGISGSKPYTASILPNVGTQPYAGVFTGLAAGTYALTVTDANGCTASTSNIVVGTLPSLTVNTSSLTVCGGSVNLNSLITTSGGSSVVWSKKPQAVQGTSGYNFHFVLLSNGTLTGWGDNAYGKLTFPVFAGPIKQIAANGNYGLALLTNGSVVGWGDNGNGQINIPTFAAPPIKLSAGLNNSLALLMNGSLVGWGNNSRGQLNFPAFPSRIKDLNSTSENNAALSVDGTVKVWGAPSPSPSIFPALNEPPTFAAPVSAVSIGLYHGLALLSNGQVQGWGYNRYGEINIPTFAAPVKQVLAGWNTSYALLTNGATVVWGDGAANDVPPTTTATPLSITGILSTVLTLYNDGSARSWGQSRIGGSDLSTYDAEALSNATVTPPVGTTTYYVVVRNTDGEYKTGEVTINASSTPAAPVVANTAVCSNESTSITVNSPGNTVRWFDATGTNVVNVGSTLTLPNLTATTAYKVRVETQEGCQSPFTDFTVTVNPKPAAPTVTASGPTAFCSGGSVTLNSNVGPNNALNFVETNSQYVTVPHSTSLNLTTSFTMEAWVNYSGINSTIVDKGNYNYLWSLNANGNGNKLGFYELSTGTWKYSTGIVPENTWTHVAITFNAGALTFFINGVASGTATTTILQDNQPLNIGRQQPTSCQCNHFNGTMDELRIWNVVRTQAQIFNNMTNTIPGNSAGLVAYYKFDEGTGNTTADATSNGNTGTFVNGPTWQTVSPLNAVQWSPSGATSPAIVATTTGTYTATMTNGYGCISSASVVVSVGSNAAAVTLASPADDYATGAILKTASSVNGKITATNKVTGTANVSYRAKSIELTNGFRADNGAVFSAAVGGCN